MTKASDQTSSLQTDIQADNTQLDILSLKIMSFGYKEGEAPSANIIFDVRFLKNPYWVENLRPLTGMDKPVQDYVMAQEAAIEFLDSFIAMLDKLIPRLIDLKVNEFSIAFGCTGGQHRSATLAELLCKELKSKYPSLNIELKHRELKNRSLSFANNDAATAEDKR